jgi:predicted nucleotidyltransferase
MTNCAKITTASTQIGDRHPALKLFILFGSRARGDHDPTSDWDLAFLSNPAEVADYPPFWFPGSELLPLLSELAGIPSDRVDLVDLSTCSDILAHYVARDGQLIYERDPGEFVRFQQQALKKPGKLHQFRPTQRQKVLATLERWGV